MLSWLERLFDDDMHLMRIFWIGILCLAVSGAVAAQGPTSFAPLVASEVQINGTLQSGDGDDLSGIVVVITNAPNITSSHHQVEGAFRITADASGGLVVLARSKGRPNAERTVPAGSSGSVTLDFKLPEGQRVKGRVVDSEGHGVPGAMVRVRYHEPEKPLRRIAFDAAEETDDNGEFMILNLGVNVPLVIDVYANGYVATSSEQLKITAGARTLPKNIELVNRGGTVIVQLRDKLDAPVAGAQVMILADPSGWPSESRGSWMHARSFHQAGNTSDLGNIRFSGVPAGKVLIRAKFADGVAEQRTTVVPDQEIPLRIVAP